MTRAECNRPRAKLAVATGGIPGVALVDLRDPDSRGRVAFVPSPSWAGAAQGYTWVLRIKAPQTGAQKHVCMEAFTSAEQRYGAMRLVERVSKRGQPWLCVD